MRKRFVHTFFFWIFFLPFFSFSQNGDDVKDTVIQIQTTVDGNAPLFSAPGRGETVLVRAVPQARLDSLRKEDDFWYANIAPERKKKVAEEPPAQQRSLTDQAWFLDLMWVIVLCSFVAVVLWYLHSVNILVFRKAAKKISDETGEESTEDIFGLNYEKEISRAVTAADYRLALRLWYLRTLKDLSDNGLIDYRYGRTNSDYVTQLRNTVHHLDFTRLTRAFEYTWYGQFPLSAETFAAMQNGFLNFKKGMSR